MTKATSKATTTKAKKTKAKTVATKKTRTTITKANGKKVAAAQKKSGKGLFAPKKLSEALASICGAKTLSRIEVTKKVWVYIKKNGLNNGRVIKPDEKLKAVLPVASLDMLKMPGHISKHLS